LSKPTGRCRAKARYRAGFVATHRFSCHCTSGEVFLFQSLMVLWGSLKTRLVLLTLTIAISGYVVLFLFAGHTVRGSVKQLLIDQQLSAVSLVASDVNEALASRLLALQDMALFLPDALAAGAPATQDLLARYPMVAGLFNQGVVVVDGSKRILAEMPASTGRVGISVADRDYVNAALLQGKSSISPPLIGKKTGHPVVVMSVPVVSRQGQVVGVLAGIVDLGMPNFLDRITQSRYGESGETFVITPQTRMIVATSDKKRVMEVLPAPGVNAWIDRFMQGYEGSAVVVNPHGLEVLVSVKQVPIAGWYTSVILSTDEAFGTINRLRNFILWVLLPLITLLLGAVIWWMLRRQLAPLMHTTQTLTALALSDQPLQPLPISRADEVGALIGGFNHLLRTLDQRQQALLESEGRFRSLADNASSLVWITDAAGQRRYFNKLWFDFTGRTLAQETSPAGDLAEGWLQGVHPDDLPRCTALYATAFAARQAYVMDYRLRRTDGVYRWLTEHGVPRYDAQGVFLGNVGTCIDITERKQSEEKLQLLASVFTHAREAVLICAADGSILDANAAAERITGYTLAELRGQNPRLFQSGRHDKAFYAAMWQSLLKQGHWSSEIWNRRKDGAHFAAMQTISAVHNADGQISHFVALLSDITAIKEHEHQLQQIAHFDPLTQLPNRTLLSDRMQQALAHAQRRGKLLAVVFLDLDGFKGINDLHGHEAGDHVLVTVARRMKLALREVDTLARLGGDEFVAVLVDLFDRQTCVALLNRLLAEAAQPVPFGSHMLQVSASIGVTFYPQDQVLDADQLLRQADQAMYQAKLMGKGCYRVFEPAKAIASASLMPSTAADKMPPA